MVVGEYKFCMYNPILNNLIEYSIGQRKIDNSDKNSKVILFQFMCWAINNPEHIKKEIIDEANQLNRAWSFELLRRIYRQLSSLDEEKLNKLIDDLLLLAISEDVCGKSRFKIAQLFSVLATEKNKLINDIISSHKERTIETLKNKIDGDFGSQSFNMFVQAFENCA